MKLTTSWYVIIYQHVTRFWHIYRSEWDNEISNVQINIVAFLRSFMKGNGVHLSIPTNSHESSSFDSLWWSSISIHDKVMLTWFIGWWSDRCADFRADGNKRFLKNPDAKHTINFKRPGGGTPSTGLFSLVVRIQLTQGRGRKLQMGNQGEFKNPK